MMTVATKTISHQLPFGTVSGNAVDHLVYHFNRFLDLERERSKMESFESYVLISVLTATASFSTLQELVPHKGIGSMSTLNVLVQLSAGISTLCGLYATVIFSLTVLYAKAAIGLNRDKIYKYFLQQTTTIRIRGFRAFSMSVICFAVEACLLTLLSVPKEIRSLTSVMVVGLLLFICSDWLCIIDTANAIYVGEVPQQDKKKNL